MRQQHAKTKTKPNAIISPLSAMGNSYSENCCEQSAPPHLVSPNSSQVQL